MSTLDQKLKKIPDEFAVLYKDDKNAIIRYEFKNIHEIVVSNNNHSFESCRIEFEHNFKGIKECLSYLDSDNFDKCCWFEITDECRNFLKDTFK